MLVKLLHKRLKNNNIQLKSILFTFKKSYRVDVRKFSSSTTSSVVKTKAMDGNESCANMSYNLTETAFLYPITPSTSMGEYFDQWSNNNRNSLIGEKPVKVIEMQSEAGAVGGLHGAIVSGSLSTTFTASQGLLLMIPNLYQFSGELLPSVFHVAARSVAKHALSIFGDHQDVMGVRQTGCALLCSSNPQETQDLALISHIATLKSRVPFLHFFDGWRTSSETTKVKLIDNETILKLFPYESLDNNLRKISLNLNNPNQRGTAMGPEIYFQSLIANNTYYNDTPNIVQNSMNEFSNIVGRKYNLFDYYGDNNAENIIIAMGSSTATIEQTIDVMRNENKDNKIGLVKCRLFRPWSIEHLLKVLSKSVKNICVLDKTKEDGAIGQPLYLDVVSSLYGNENYSNVKIVGGIYGISSKDFTPAMIRSVFNNLTLDKPKNNFVIGINDDVTFTSLDYSKYLTMDEGIPKDITQAMFIGMGSDGTVGANKQCIKDISDNTDLNVQGYYVYDAHKSGGVTISHLRFGKSEIKAEYEIQQNQSDYTSINNSQWIFKYGEEIIDKIKPNSILVINSIWTTPELMDTHLPDYFKKELSDKNIKLYNIDANSVANEVGLKKRINWILQSCFYKLSNVLPENIGLDLLKKSIHKLYSDKGQEIVNINIKGIENSLNSLKLINYDKNKWSSIIVDNTDDISMKTGVAFVDEIMKPISKLEGNTIPVSVFYKNMLGGVSPKSTSKYEERGIASHIPSWNENKCSQCNYCAFVCPHSVIRPYLLTKNEVNKKPEKFKTAKLKSNTNPLLSNYQYSLQLSPLDCTGCGVCAQSCPDDALSMIEFATEYDTAKTNWNFSINNINPNEYSQLQDKFSVKGSQFTVPKLEFHGACAGCGEGVYVKLLSQMFGDNITIANATGCSSIWGGSAPSNPYGIPWANSLFEDNAEFGYGMALGSQQRRLKLQQRILNNINNIKNENDKKLFEIYLNTFDNNIDENNKIVDNIINNKEYFLNTYPNLFKNDYGIDVLKKQYNWIIGGDGWAYDIGFGGLDHVISKGENVNILVLDTEMYSNTGGQSSKATPLSASVKFAEGGMSKNKKDLGQMAMLYNDVYVASIALGADFNQTINAFKEANEYKGTSLIIALAPCRDWGVDLKYMIDLQKEAVETGYWPLYRYNPNLVKQNKNPFILDSKKIKKELQSVFKQHRFNKLTLKDKDRAIKMHEGLEAFIHKRHKKLIRSSMDDVDYLKFLQSKLGVNKPIDVDKTVSILYGSETGHAKTLAHTLSNELKNRDMHVLNTISCDDWNYEELIENQNKQNVIFCVSTCGQGDYPYNIKYFMKYLDDLLKHKDKNLLNHINFSIMGLGDSNYIYFNKTATDLENKLLLLGANKLNNTGLGNDQDIDKYDTVYEEEWLPTLINKMNINTEKTLSEATYEIGRNIREDKCDEYIPAKEIVSELRLTKNIKLCPDNYERDFRHIEFDITEQNELQFNVGDCLKIYPKNQIENVNKICDIYKCDKNEIIEVHNKAKNENYLITVNDLFMKKLDIQGKPKRSFYELLKLCNGNESQVNELNHLLSEQGKNDFNSLRNDSTPNYIDLLLKYNESKIPLDYLIQYIPDIQARLYSIANSPNMYKNELHLFVHKNDWYTKKDNIFKEGTCTSYLKDLNNNSNNIYGCIQNGTIYVPNIYNQPIILAGTGCGLAPLRAHIQDRIYRYDNKNNGIISLFYGTRNSKYENFYNDEFQTYKENGKILKNVYHAFSRDQKEKIYIQDIMKENDKVIYDEFIEKKGYFYYCGQGGNTPNVIRGVIKDSIIKYGGLNEKDAEQMLIDLQINGRYNTESW